MSVTLAQYENATEILKLLRVDVGALQYTRNVALLVQQGNYAAHEWQCALNGWPVNKSALDENTRYLEETSPSKIARIFARAMHRLGRSANMPQWIPNRPMKAWEPRIIANYFLKHAGGLGVLNFIDEDIEKRTARTRAVNYKLVIQIMRHEYETTTSNYKTLISSALPQAITLMIDDLAACRDPSISRSYIEESYRDILNSSAFTEKEKAIVRAMRSIANDIKGEPAKSIIADWVMTNEDLEDVASYLVFRELGTHRPSRPTKKPAP